MRPEVDARAPGGVRSRLLDVLRHEGTTGIECLRATMFSARDASLVRARAVARGAEPPGSAAEGRALGTLYGMAVGDAIGARVEFEPVDYRARALTGMGAGRGGAFRLAPGQWTDDTSMGLCLADSLLARGGALDAHDLVHRFLAWWHCGYDTAFRLEARARRAVGLGGNIHAALAAYVRCPRGATAAGNAHTSGNGSVMRNAAVAVCCHADIARAEQVAREQSLTTHQGTEAAECCRLLAHICVRALHCRLHGRAAVVEVLTSLGTSFSSPVASVQALARAEREEGGGPDRDWRWRRAHHRYSPTRAREQPGYVGSYAMDATAMALHCVWATESFEAAVLKAANMRGDADSVAAVTGQVAGAFYGIEGVPREWVETVAQWDGYTIALRAYRLFHGIWWSPRELDDEGGDAIPNEPAPSMTDGNTMEEDDDDDWDENEGEGEGADEEATQPLDLTPSDENAKEGSAEMKDEGEYRAQPPVLPPPDTNTKEESADMKDEDEDAVLPPILPPQVNAMEEKEIDLSDEVEGTTSLPVSTFPDENVKEEEVDDGDF